MRRYRIGILALIVLLTASAAIAQDERDVVFIHGLNSKGSTWDPVVADLTAKLAIRPHQPTLDWTTYYESQASSLDQKVPGLPSDTVAVGHSNGGVVARQWSRKKRLGALITVGSPNQGAPIVDHIFDWLGFFQDYASRQENIQKVYTYRVNQDTWWWLPAQWSSMFAAGFDVWSASRNGFLSLGLDYRVPVSSQMRVWSGYMANLNSPANRDREAAEVKHQTALVYVAKNFRHGGPLRAAFPDNYGFWHNAIFATGFSLEALAVTIRIMAEPQDLAAFDLADQFSTFGDWFLDLEEVWCRAVSDPSPLPVAQCRENDGVVPAWSQAYDFPRLPLVIRENSLAHSEETTKSADDLYSVLANFVGVPRRGILPTPPGTSPPPSPGRYKIEGDRCVWNATDTGPNQCTPLPEPPGRFKLDGLGTCYWDPMDSPPDQCVPAPIVTGRYKLDGQGGCYWDASDSGPAQCVP